MKLGDARLIKCAVPTVAILEQQELAFEGTVISIDRPEVTLEVKTWFRGSGADTAVIRTASEQLRLALSGVELERGSRYLIVATDGQVALCGLSDRRTSDLAALYEQAFAG
ncbi:MAG: hypothetical protein ACRCYQ_00285 [Nocardioides sp.]